jgi:hypothetical protein
VTVSSADFIGQSERPRRHSPSGRPPDAGDRLRHAMDRPCSHGHSSIPSSLPSFLSPHWPALKA